MGRVQSIASTSSQGKSRVRELGSTGRGAVHHVARGGSGRAMERLEGDWRALNEGRGGFKDRRRDLFSSEVA
jgi:hypothetical protein